MRPTFHTFDCPDWNCSYGDATKWCISVLLECDQNIEGIGYSVGPVSAKISVLSACWWTASTCNHLRLRSTDIGTHNSVMSGLFKQQNWRHSCLGKGILSCLTLLLSQPKINIALYMFVWPHILYDMTWGCHCNMEPLSYGTWPAPFKW
jgi:hypothetical protein